MKTIIALTILIFVVPINCQEKRFTDITKTKKSQKIESFTLKGTLINEDGTPASDLPVNISNVTETGWGFILETDSVGKVKTPLGITNSNGHFEIDIKRSFLQPNNKITLHCFKNLQRIQLTHLEGKIEVPVVIEISTDVKTINLDKIVGKLVIK